MRLKAEWMVELLRYELALAGLLLKLANHYSTRGARGEVLVTVIVLSAGYIDLFKSYLY